MGYHASYRREVQTKPPYELVRTGSYYEGDLCSGHVVADEEHPIFHRQYFTRVEETRSVDIIV